MSESIYLRLAGPLQSWAGERVSGTIVNTNRTPGHRPLVGLLAACMGLTRDEISSWPWETEFAVREDRSGTVITEFQTINPREEDAKFQAIMWTLATNKKFTASSFFTPQQQVKEPTVINRTYLSGAEFMVEVRNPELHDRLVAAVRNPVFSPYLGKKAFTPVFPFYLGHGVSGQLDKLPAFYSAHENRWWDLVGADDAKQAVTQRLKCRKITRSSESRPYLVDVPAYRDHSEWLAAVAAVSELNR